MKYYYRNEDEERNVILFRRLMAKYKLKPYIANPHTPWHVHCLIGTPMNYPQLLNFWPHKLKGYWDGLAGSREGLRELEDMIKQARDYVEDHNPVIDDLDEWWD